MFQVFCEMFSLQVKLSAIAGLYHNIRRGCEFSFSFFLFNFEIMNMDRLTIMPSDM